MGEGGGTYVGSASGLPSIRNVEASFHITAVLPFSSSH